MHSVAQIADMAGFNKTYKLRRKDARLIHKADPTQAPKDRVKDMFKKAKVKNANTTGAFFCFVFVCYTNVGSHI